MSCEAYIDDDLAEDQSCQSCIDFCSKIADEDTDNDYVTADKEEVWSLAYEELDLSIFLTPSWDFPTFEHFVALSVGWSVFDQYLYEFTSEESDVQFAELMLDWWMVT